MVGVNRYFRYSKISEARFRRLVRLFALDLTATQTAELGFERAQTAETDLLRSTRFVEAISIQLFEPDSLLAPLVS